jgi:hypothetical protein
MTKQARLAWPEPPPPVPKGLTREIFINLPLSFTLNRDVMEAMVTKGSLSQQDADRLVQEDEYRKAINAVLDYFNYWELRDWGQQVDRTGRWSTPPSFVGTRRDAVWNAFQERLQSVNGEAARVA